MTRKKKWFQVSQKGGSPSPYSPNGKRGRGSPPKEEKRKIMLSEKERGRIAQGRGKKKGVRMLWPLGT